MGRRRRLWVSMYRWIFVRNMEVCGIVGVGLQMAVEMDNTDWPVGSVYTS